MRGLLPFIRADLGRRVLPAIFAQDAAGPGEGSKHGSFALAVGFPDSEALEQVAGAVDLRGRGIRTLDDAMFDDDDVERAPRTVLPLSISDASYSHTGRQVEFSFGLELGRRETGSRAPSALGEPASQSRSLGDRPPCC